MFEIIKKTMLTGIGLAAVTREKIEEIAEDLIEKGQITEKEGKEFIDELMKKSEQARTDLEKKVEDIVRKALKKMNVATKEDIAGLEKKIRQMGEREDKDKD